MIIEVQRIGPESKQLLSNLAQLYQYDFSEIEGGDVDAAGVYNYVDLNPYFEEQDRYAFLVLVNATPAGFVLVSKHSYLSVENDTMEISEFFIMRKYRGQNLGEQVAMRIFDIFPGKWELQETAHNSGATAFWRKVLGRYTGGHYEEVVLDDERWRGPVHSFSSPEQG